MAATIPTNGIVLNSGLNVADGDITLADGHGISFASTSDGTTMASELFDDYEEGSYTPTLTDSAGDVTSIALNSSYDTLAYTKVGRRVSIQGVIVISSFSGSWGSGGLTMTLPFTVGNLTDQQGRCIIGVGTYNVDFTNDATAPYFLTSEGASTANMQVSKDNAGGGIGQPSSSGQLYIQGSYIA
jgi:hypothetical protein